MGVRDGSSTGEASPRRVEALRAIRSIAVPAAISLFLFHFAVILLTSVDLPFWDDWAALEPGALPAGLTWRWLFAPHNEHEIVTTKLLIWILYRLDGWNVARHQALNFLLYGLLVLCVARFAKRECPTLERGTIAGFVLFLFTTIARQNHNWAWQSQFHFALIFALLAVFALFDERQRASRLAAGAAMACVSIFSMSTGLICSASLATAYAVWKILRAREGGGGGARELAGLGAVLTVLMASLGLCSSTFHATSPSQALGSSPLTMQFWSFFLNLVSHGFGWNAISAPLGALCLAVVAVPMALELVKRRDRPALAPWPLLAVAGGILGSLGAIAFGRGGQGIEFSKVARYGEIAMLLTPLAAVAWARLLEGAARARRGALIALWLFACAGYSDKWHWEWYVRVAEARLLAVPALERYYAGTGDGRCPTISDHPLGPELDAARRLDLSFYRKLEARSLKLDGKQCLR